jgi:hypothetical protein
MTDLRATEHPPLPRREGDEQSDEEQCRDRPLDDQSLRILKSPSDVHLPPPDQADDPDDPEQAGSHQCEGTGLRAEPHQPIREVEDEDPPDGLEDGYEIKVISVPQPRKNSAYNDLTPVFCSIATHAPLASRLQRLQSGMVARLISPPRAAWKVHTGVPGLVRASCYPHDF